MLATRSYFFSALAISATSAFTLYPSMNATALAGIFGVDDGCMSALNNTFNCDQGTFSMAGSVHSYQWDQDDLTTLCTSECTTGAKQWEQNVVSKCDGQTININGMLVPVDTVAGRYVDGMGVACLKSSNQSFCMLESQDWVGADATASTDAGNATSGPRIATLYEDATLCSDCFINMLYTRLSSEYLPVEDHSEYLVEQFQDIQDVCSTTVQPPLTTRAAPTYQPVPTTTPTGAPASNGTTPTNGTCVGGQLIIDGAQKRDRFPYTPQKRASSPWVANYIRSSSSNLFSGLVSRDGASAANSSLGTSAGNNTGTCDALSLKYGVTTGDLQDVTDSEDCSGACNKCVPARCDLRKVPAGASCDSLVHTFSTDTMNITTYQLLSWNLNIIGLCDALQEGQYVCAGPPGGAYKPIDSPLGNTGNASSQARGGGDGGSSGGSSSSDTSSTSPSSDAGNAVSTPAMPGSAAGSSSPSPTSSSPSTSRGASASATQSGIVTGCKKFVEAKKGDNCVDFAKANKLDANSFYDMNKVLDGGKACDTKFQSGENYCIEA